MSSRLTVIFFILLCLEAGIVLAVAPWVQWFGLGDWGDNFFLVMVAQKTGLVGLQHAVGSGWVRGAVTGLGLLNMGMAVWEMFHFNETVRRLEGASAPSKPAPTPTPDAASARPTTNEPFLAADSLPTTTDAPDAASAPATDHVPHHERRDV